MPESDLMVRVPEFDLLGEKSTRVGEEPASRSSGDDSKREELQEYRELISELADAADGRVVFNRDFDRAAIILEFLFAKSRREVDIVTRNLIEKIFAKPELVSAAIRFLKHDGARLNIVSEEKIPPTHPLIRALNDGGLGERVDLRVMPSDMKAQVKFYLAVGDDRHFRFEQEPRPHEICDAVVQFGGSELGKEISEKFWQLRSQLDRAETR